MSAITLFSILDGIVSDVEYGAANLADARAVEDYASACGREITRDEAERIQRVGAEWTARRTHDASGEWSRFRGEAEAALRE